MDETTTNLWDINASVVITIPVGILTDDRFPFKIEKDGKGQIKNKELMIRIDQTKKTLIIFEPKIKEAIKWTKN